MAKKNKINMRNHCDKCSAKTFVEYHHVFDACLCGECLADILNGIDFVDEYMGPHPYHTRERYGSSSTPYPR